MKVYIYICREKRQSGRISHASSRDQHGRVHRGQRTRERGEGEGHGGMMEEGRMEEERSPSTCNIVITAWRSFIGTPAPLFIIHLESTGRDLVLLFWNKERVNPPSRSLLEKSAVRFVQDLSSTIVFFFKKILRKEC